MMEYIEPIVQVGSLFLAGAFAGAASAYLGFRDKHASDPSEKLDGEKIMITTARQAIIGGVAMIVAVGTLPPMWAALVSALVAVGGDTIGRRIWEVLKAKFGENAATGYIDKILS